MKRILVFFCSAALLAAQSDLTGKWDVTATPDGGKSPMKLNAELKGAGNDLGGTVNSALGAGPVKNATRTGDDLTFQFMIGKYLFDVKAAVNEGTEIKGNFTGPRNMKGVFLAKRTDLPAITAPVEGVEVGDLKGAGYRIDIPKNFNGELVVYCHGYGGSSKFSKDSAPTALMKAFLDLGYAVAQSGYRAGGWAVKEGVEDTEDLRKYFVSKYGKPRRAWVTGHSMGGTITIATIEQFPDAYDGALQMCGPAGPIQPMFQRRVFDTLVVYDYYFPGIIGSPVEFTANVEPGPEFLQQIQKEAQQYPDRLSGFQKWSGFQSEVEVSQVVAFYSIIQKELMTRTGGNAFDNRNTLYQGSPDDQALNRGVKRYAGAPVAVDYLKKYYTPTGELTKPMLSLHTTYDPLIPAWSANEYSDIARLKGTGDLYVQRYVARNGHCSFTAGETANAFRDLVNWRTTGQRPESGEQK